MPEKATYWKRVYRVVFPDINLMYSNEDGKDSLKVSFNIVKDLTRGTNKSVLKIYNLNKDSRTKICVADLVCEIFAGYRDNQGAKKIFRGTVISAKTDFRTNGDIITELRLSDGQKEIRDNWFALSFPPNTQGNSIIEAIASNMGLAIAFGRDVKFGTYVNGYSAAGQGADMLDAICAGSGVTWSVQNGVLSIIMDGGTTAATAIVFSANSGLIGTPRRIVRANPKADKPTPRRKRRRKEKKEKYEKKSGWEITTLMSPTVSPGDVVKVESKAINNFFRVETVRHDGDTSGSWRSRFELIEGLVTGANG